MRGMDEDEVPVRELPDEELRGAVLRDPPNDPLGELRGELRGAE